MCCGADSQGIVVFGISIEGKLGKLTDGMLGITTAGALIDGMLGKLSEGILGVAVDELLAPMLGRVGRLKVGMLIEGMLWSLF